VGLHCEPLPALTSFGYFRQGQSNRISIPAGNGATGASGTGPVLGYTLNLFWFNFLFILISKNNMNTCTYLINTLSLIYAMKLLVIFGIKIYRKLRSYVTPWSPSVSPCRRDELRLPPASLEGHHCCGRVLVLAASAAMTKRSRIRDVLLEAVMAS
jgi:hypothetical protein